MIEVRSYKSSSKTITRTAVVEAVTNSPWRSSNATVVNAGHKAVGHEGANLKDINKMLRGGKEPVPELTAAKSRAYTG